MLPQTGRDGVYMAARWHSAYDGQQGNLHGWRTTTLPRAAGEGRLVQRELQPGLNLSLGEFALAGSFAVKDSTEGPSLSLGCLVDGSMPWAFTDRKLMSGAGDGALLWSAPEPLQFRAAHTARVRMLSLTVSPLFLQSKLDGHGLPGCKKLDRLLSGGGRRTSSFGELWPMSATARAAAIQAFDAIGDPLGGLRAESLALTILHEHLSQFAPRPPRPDARERPTAGERERFYEVKRILTENPERSPSLAELARTVATNEWALKRGFRQTFGMTVYEFLRKERMALAGRLLAEGMSVAAVAKRAGYESGGRFAAAFRKHAGTSPKRYQLERR